MLNVVAHYVVKECLEALHLDPPFDLLIRDAAHGQLRNVHDVCLLEVEDVFEEDPIPFLLFLNLVSIIIKESSLLAIFVIIFLIHFLLIRVGHLRSFFVEQVLL